MANPKSKSARKAVVFSLIVLVIGGLSAVAFFRKKEVIITIQTEKVARRNLTELVVATGKIQPVVQVVINPEVSGEIIALPVKEGQVVKKGDLLLKIKPDNYIASRNSAEASLQSSLASKSSAEASYLSSLAGKSQSQAECDKSEAEYKRNEPLFKAKLVSESVFLDVKTAFEVAKLRCETSLHQVEMSKAQASASKHQADMAKAQLARAEDDLAKTTILSPTDGTVTKLKSQLGERVLGTSMMAGTEIMTIAKLDDMEARVDIGEIDVVLIALGQKTRLEVDSFRDRKFTGVVTEIANAAKGSGLGTQQESTKFEVKIRIEDKESFRPGMSVTAEVETRYRTNVVVVPIQSVTTRLPKDSADGKNAVVAKPDAKDLDKDETVALNKKKTKDAPKPVEVVFELKDSKVKTAKVKRGISDDAYVEILEGLKEGQEIVSGGYKAINRELEDDKPVKVDNAKKTFGGEKKSL